MHDNNYQWDYNRGDVYPRWEAWGDLDQAPPVLHLETVPAC